VTKRNPDRPEGRASETMPPSQPNVDAAGAAYLFSGRFWLLLIATGIGAGLGGCLLLALLQAVQHLSWSYHSGTFLDGVQQSSASRQVIVLLCAGVLAGAGRWLSRRTTGGHGGEVSEAIWFHSGELPTVRTLGRAVLSIVVVGMGVSLGREGAAKQTGAWVASQLSRWMKLPPSQRRLLAACGAGAGIAAIYNVPLGGALFAVEVLLGELALPVVFPVLVASFIATSVAWIFAPLRPEFHVPFYSLTLQQALWAALAGPVFGLASVLYVRLIAWADARKPRGWRLVVAPVLVITALGATSIKFPQLLGNGMDVVQLAYGDDLALWLLVVLVALKPLVTASCLGSGAPGGLFMPTVTFGAVLGGSLGRLWDSFWPGAQAGSYAMIGSGAVLAAATQGPLSAVVLVLELTQRVDALMVPLLVAVAGAVLVARRLEPRSIYSARLHLGKRAASKEKPSISTAFDDRLSRDYETVSSAEHYVNVARRLLARGHRRLPLYVIDERGVVVGELKEYPDSLSDPSKLAMPLETTTAADLAESVPVLESTLSAAEVEEQLRESGRDSLPVVEADSRRLIGVVRRAFVPNDL
jgi:chloride channel protein, CIC family